MCSTRLLGTAISSDCQRVTVLTWTPKASENPLSDSPSRRRNILTCLPVTLDHPLSAWTCTTKKALDPICCQVPDSKGLFRRGSCEVQHLRGCVSHVNALGSSRRRPAFGHRVSGPASGGHARKYSRSNWNCDWMRPGRIRGAAVGDPIGILGGFGHREPSTHRWCVSASRGVYLLGVPGQSVRCRGEPGRPASTPVPARRCIC